MFCLLRALVRHCIYFGLAHDSVAQIIRLPVDVGRVLTYLFIHDTCVGVPVVNEARSDHIAARALHASFAFLFL